MKELVDRLEAIERLLMARQMRVYLWADRDEPSEAAVGRRFPGGMPLGCSATVYCWKAPEPPSPWMLEQDARLSQ